MERQAPLLFRLSLMVNLLSVTVGVRVLSCTDCARTVNLCRRISGLYTVTVLTKGTYNPVVEIPSPACNINITEFGVSNNYIGLKTQDGQGIINSYWALGQPGQYYGAGARFAYDRGSVTCKGSCISSDGPTSEAVVVQILYYAKNPGISYQFTVPNQVIVTPFDGTYSKQNNTEAWSDAASFQETYSTSSKIRHRGSRHHQNRRNRPSHRQVEIGRFRGEYYIGAQEQPSRRGTESRVMERYRPRPVRPTVVRKVAAPKYVSGPRRHTSYPRRSPYESFASKTDYLDKYNALEQYERTSIFKTYNGNGATANRGYEGRDFIWKISGFTKCSKTCGGGVQKANIVCVSTNDHTEVVVTPKDCANPHKPREQIVECNTSPCDPAWESDEWSACSKTCGSGIQTRTVECRRRFSMSLTLRVSADKCGLGAKPAAAQQCEKGLCAHWKTREWGQCSRECGGGEMTRSIHCVDQYQFQIPQNYCNIAAPKQRKSCNLHRCSASWWLSDWDKECSTSCGQGHLVRDAVCMNNGGQVVSDIHCQRTERPRLRETCTSDASCSGVWFVGPWDSCSASCGEGSRTRHVVCLSKTFNSLAMTDDHVCDIAARPVTQESCVNSQPQCSATWYTKDWSHCSVTCGEGYRTRDVQCVENQETSILCVVAVKPITREACTRSPCLRYQMTSKYVQPRPNKQREELEAEDSRCRDILLECLYVLQSRLCAYPYYKEKCCYTCTKKFK